MSFSYGVLHLNWTSGVKDMDLLMQTIKR